MARSITSGMISQITAASLKPFIAVEIVFEQSVSRAWSGHGTIQVDGSDYIGVGTFGSISAINETTENKAVGVELRLSGIPSDLISLSLGENYQGNPCSIYLGALTESHAVVVDPYKIFSGRIDTMNINEGDESATITVTAENRMIDMTRARVRRYTKEDQKGDFPNDKGLDYVASLQEKTITWGVNS